MPIDSNIYLQAQQQAPDIGNTIQQGMNLRQMAYNQDRQKKQDQIAEGQRQIEMIGRIAPGIKDQASYESGLAELSKQGVDVSKMPQAYDPNLVNHYANLALSAKDQAENQLKRDDFAQREADRQDNRDERRAMFNLRLQDQKDARDARRQDNNIKLAQMQDEKTDKLLKDMKNDLDADRGRSGNFGQISAKVQQADRLKTLINSYKNGDLPPQQMEELALGMDNMLAGSSGASRAQVEALVPHTWWGGKQSAQQWLMNEPMGAGQQKFVESMAHTIDRERETANDQLNNIRVSRLAAHDHVKKLSPEQYNNVLRSYGLDPDNIKGGKYQAPPSGLVLMKDPQGNIRQVSADQVEAAKKAGGSLVSEQVAGK